MVWTFTLREFERPRKHLESTYSWLPCPLYDVSPPRIIHMLVSLSRLFAPFRCSSAMADSQRLQYNGAHARQTMLQWHNCDLERASHSAVRHCDAAATRLICHSGNVGELM